MMKLLFILSFIAFNFLNAQVNKPFSNFDIGFYSGVNFYKTDNIRGGLLLETKTNLTSSIKLKASAGYFRTIQPKTYNIKRFSENQNDSLPRFTASEYNLVSKNYDVFPIALGMKYNFDKAIFSPYVTIDVVYNFINTFIETTPPEVWFYESIDEIPVEFMDEQRKEELPVNSYGIMLGAGTAYKISSALNLDFRYFFKYDNKIINTHNFIVGIYF